MTYLFKPFVVHQRLSTAFETEAFKDNDFKKIKLSDFKGKWVILFFYPGLVRKHCICAYRYHLAVLVEEFLVVLCKALQLCQAYSLADVKCSS